MHGAYVLGRKTTFDSCQRGLIFSFQPTFSHWNFSIFEVIYRQIL